MKQTVRVAVLFLLGSVVASSVAAEGPAGWRQDGSGRFPKSAPPLEWSKDKNVLWKTRLPGPSFGSPILVGERLFVVSDPAELLCVRPSDGKVLWQRSSSLEEVFGPAKAKEIAEQYARLDEERARLNREMNKLRKEGPAEKEKLDKLRQKVRDADLAVQALQKKVPRKAARGGAGNTAATPVSDGKHVAAVFGNGIVAAYTTEGKRLWVRFIEAPVLGFGHSGSPVLLGGKLIVHLKDLVALDVATGKELWRVALPASHASPLATRLGEEDVLIAPAGAVVRARDGKVLGEGKFQAAEGTPVLRDGVLYVSRPGTLQALKLSRQGVGAVVLEELWKAEGSRERRTPSSVQHDGLLYGVTTNGFIDVTDMKTGEIVYRHRLPLNQVYSSVTLAGGHLFVFDTRGKAVVLKPGRRYEQVALNQLEGTGACPVVAGDRLLVRGQQHLYCLGTPAGGPKGRE
jgi:outer membrane protein assembly factor BamB